MEIINGAVENILKSQINNNQSLIDGTVLANLQSIREVDEVEVSNAVCAYWEKYRRSNIPMNDLVCFTQALKQAGFTIIKGEK